VRKKPRERKPIPRWRKSRLEELIRRALGEAEDDEERQQAFFDAIEEHLRVPFRIRLEGGPAVVRGIAVDDADEIVAVCTREAERFPVPLLELPLPRPAPAGAEWIEAYRLWLTE
jgi:hypothetical protein